MSTKHTPGPWRLSETARDAVVCDDVSGHDTSDNVDYYEGHLIAESIIGSANRLLIAAAPDLLEALEWMLHAHGADVDGGESDVIDKARAAIAKATGSES